jgi:Mor family transcriptional regulator
MFYYVYLYRDPRDLQPFYVRKGCGKRSTCHLRETVETTENIRKFEQIESIRKDGQIPIIEMVEENLTSIEAYHLETKTIKHYGRRNLDPNGILTNKNIGGKDAGNHLLWQISSDDLASIKDWSGNVAELAKKYQVSVGTVYNLRPTRFRKISEIEERMILESTLNLREICEKFKVGSETVRKIKGRVQNGRLTEEQKVMLENHEISAKDAVTAFGISFSTASRYYRNRGR